MTETEERSDGVTEQQVILAGARYVLQAVKSGGSNSYSISGMLDALEAAFAELVADRDRARRVAVALEQQVAAVEELHVAEDEEWYPYYTDSETPEQVRVCRHCSRIREHGGGEGEPARWPCPTIAALSPSDEKDGDEG